MDEVLITIAYALLLAWGVFVALQLIWQGLNGRRGSSTRSSRTDTRCGCSRGTSWWCRWTSS
jgi:hypothetical protein